MQHLPPQPILGGPSSGFTNSASDLPISSAVDPHNRHDFHPKLHPVSRQTVRFAAGGCLNIFWPAEIRVEGDTVTLHYVRHGARGPIEPCWHPPIRAAACSTTR